MRRKNFLKGIAILTLVSFAAEQVSFAQTGAWKTPHLEFVPQSFVGRFELPEELGRIRERWFPATAAEFSRPFALPEIWIVQDLHGHYEAQKGIENLLGYLKEKTGFGQLFIEGGTGGLDPQRIRFFEEEEANREAAHLLAREAEIGGPELFLLSREDVRAFGAEDPELYLKNLESFRVFWNHAQDAELFLNRKLERIRTRASRHFGAELHGIFKAWLGHELFAGDLGHYLHVLEKEASRTLGLRFTDPFAQADWPMLVRFFELKRRENKIQLTAASEELKALIDWCRRNSIREETIRKLAALDSEERPALRERRHFWEQFYAEARPRGFAFRDYPELFFTEGFHILREEIDAVLFFEEIGRFRERILLELGKTSEEREILREFDGYLLLKKLFSLELTREEFQELNGRLRGEESIPREIGEAFRAALSFYEIALSRDSKMAEQVLREKAEGATAVLIAGGFHTRGLTGLLREKGISYAVLEPHVTELDAENRYKASLLGDTSLDFERFTMRGANWLSQWEGRLPGPLARRRDLIVQKILERGTSRGATPRPEFAALHRTGTGRSEMREEISLYEAKLEEILDPERTKGWSADRWMKEIAAILEYHFADEIQELRQEKAGERAQASAGRLPVAEKPRLTTDFLRKAPGLETAADLWTAAADAFRTISITEAPGAVQAKPSLGEREKDVIGIADQHFEADLIHLMEQYNRGLWPFEKIREAFLDYFAYVNRILKAKHEDEASGEPQALRDLLASAPLKEHETNAFLQIRELERSQGYRAHLLLLNMGLADPDAPDNPDLLFTPASLLIARKAGLVPKHTKEEIAALFDPPGIPARKIPGEYRALGRSNPVRSVTAARGPGVYPPFLIIEFSYPPAGYLSRFLRASVLRSELPPLPAAEEVTETFLRENFVYDTDDTGLGAFLVTGGEPEDVQKERVSRLREIAGNGLLLVQDHYELGPEEDHFRLYAEAIGRENAARNAGTEKDAIRTAAYRRQQMIATSAAYLQFAEKLGAGSYPVESDEMNRKIMAVQMARIERLVYERPQGRDILAPLREAVEDSAHAQYYTAQPPRSPDSGPRFFAPLVSLLIAHDREGNFLVPEEQRLEFIKGLIALFDAAAKKNFLAAVGRVSAKIAPADESPFAAEPVEEKRNIVRFEILYRLLHDMLSQQEYFRAKRDLFWMFLVNFAERHWNADLSASRVWMLVRGEDAGRRLLQESNDRHYPLLWEFLLDPREANVTGDLALGALLLGFIDRKFSPDPLPEHLRGLDLRSLKESKINLTETGTRAGQIETKLLPFATHIEALGLEGMIQEKRRTVLERQAFYDDILAVREYYETGRDEEALAIVEKYLPSQEGAQSLFMPLPPDAVEGAIRALMQMKERLAAEGALRRALQSGDARAALTALRQRMSEVPAGADGLKAWSTDYPESFEQLLDLLETVVNGSENLTPEERIELHALNIRVMPALDLGEKDSVGVLTALELGSMLAAYEDMDPRDFEKESDLLREIETLDPQNPVLIRRQKETNLEKEITQLLTEIQSQGAASYNRLSERIRTLEAQLDRLRSGMVLPPEWPETAVRLPYSAGRRLLKQRLEGAVLALEAKRIEGEIDRKKKASSAPYVLRPRAHFQPGKRELQNEILALAQRFGEAARDTVLSLNHSLNRAEASLPAARSELRGEEEILKEAVHEFERRHQGFSPSNLFRYGVFVPRTFLDSDGPLPGQNLLLMPASVYDKDAFHEFSLARLPVELTEKLGLENGAFSWVPVEMILHYPLQRRLKGHVVSASKMRMHLLQVRGEKGEYLISFKPLIRNHFWLGSAVKPKRQSPIPRALRPDSAPEPPPGPDASRFWLVSDGGRLKLTRQKPDDPSAFPVAVMAFQEDAVQPVHHVVLGKREYLIEVGAHGTGPKEGHLRLVHAVSRVEWKGNELQATGAKQFELTVPKDRQTAELLLHILNEIPAERFPENLETMNAAGRLPSGVLYSSLETNFDAEKEDSSLQVTSSKTYFEFVRAWLRALSARTAEDFHVRLLGSLQGSEPGASLKPFAEETVSYEFITDMLISPDREIALPYYRPAVVMMFGDKPVVMAVRQVEAKSGEGNLLFALPPEIEFYYLRKSGHLVKALPNPYGLLEIPAGPRTAVYLIDRNANRAVRLMQMRIDGRKNVTFKAGFTYNGRTVRPERFAESLSRFFWHKAVGESLDSRHLSKPESDRAKAVLEQAERKTRSDFQKGLAQIMRFLLAPDKIPSAPSFYHTLRVLLAGGLRHMDMAAPYRLPDGSLRVEAGLMLLEDADIQKSPGEPLPIRLEWFPSDNGHRISVSGLASGERSFVFSSAKGMTDHLNRLGYLREIFEAEEVSEKMIRIRLNGGNESVTLYPQEPENMLRLLGRALQRAEAIARQYTGLRLDPAILESLSAPAPPEELFYYALHKPALTLSTREDETEDRKTIYDLFQEQTGLDPAGFFPTGRLDYDVTGLVILSNDGALTAITMPAGHVDKHYEVLVRGRVSDEDLEALRKGVHIHTKNVRNEPVVYHTQPAKAEAVRVSDEESLIRLSIREGKYHQVKAMMAAVGHPVIELHRSGIGPLHLKDLAVPYGRVQKLTAGQAAPLLGAKEEALIKLNELAEASPVLATHYYMALLRRSAQAVKTFAAGRILELARSDQKRPFIIRGILTAHAWEEKEMEPYIPALIAKIAEEFPEDTMRILAESHGAMEGKLRPLVEALAHLLLDHSQSGREMKIMRELEKKWRWGRDHQSDFEFITQILIRRSVLRTSGPEGFLSNEAMGLRSELRTSGPEGFLSNEAMGLRSELRAFTGDREGRPALMTFERIYEGFGFGAFTLQDYLSKFSAKDAATVRGHLQTLAALGILRKEGPSGTEGRVFHKLQAFDPERLGELKFVLGAYVTGRDGEFVASQMRQIREDGSLFSVSSGFWDYENETRSLKAADLGIKTANLYLTYDLLRRHFRRGWVKTSSIYSLTAGISPNSFRQQLRLLEKLALIERNASAPDWIRLRPEALDDLKARRIDVIMLDYAKDQDYVRLQSRLERLAKDGADEISEEGLDLFGLFPRHEGWPMGKIQITLEGILRAMERISEKRRRPRLTDIAAEMDLAAFRALNAFARVNGVSLRRIGIWGLALPREKEKLEALIDGALQRLRGGNPAYARMPVLAADLADELFLLAPGQLYERLVQAGIDLREKGVFMPADRSDARKRYARDFLASVGMKPSESSVNYLLGITPKAGETAMAPEERDRLLELLEGWRSGLEPRRSRERYDYVSSLIERAAGGFREAVESGDLKRVNRQRYHLNAIAPGHPAAWQRVVPERRPEMEKAERRRMEGVIWRHIYGDQADRLSLRIMRDSGVIYNSRLLSSYRENREVPEFLQAVMTQLRDEVSAPYIWEVKDDWLVIRSAARSELRSLPLLAQALQEEETRILGYYPETFLIVAAAAMAVAFGYYYFRSRILPAMVVPDYAERKKFVRELVERFKNQFERPGRPAEIRSARDRLIREYRKKYGKAGRIENLAALGDVLKQTFAEKLEYDLILRLALEEQRLLRERGVSEEEIARQWPAEVTRPLVSEMVHSFRRWRGKRHKARAEADRQKAAQQQKKKESVTQSPRETRREKPPAVKSMPEPPAPAAPSIITPPPAPAPAPAAITAEPVEIKISLDEAFRRFTEALESRMGAIARLAGRTWKQTELSAYEAQLRSSIEKKIREIAPLLEREEAVAFRESAAALDWVVAAFRAVETRKEELTAEEHRAQEMEARFLELQETLLGDLEHYASERTPLTAHPGIAAFRAEVEQGTANPEMRRSLMNRLDALSTEIENNRLKRSEDIARERLKQELAKLEAALLENMSGTERDAEEIRVHQTAFGRLADEWVRDLRERARWEKRLRQVLQKAEDKSLEKKRETARERMDVALGNLRKEIETDVRTLKTYGELIPYHPASAEFQQVLRTQPLDDREKARYQRKLSEHLQALRRKADAILGDPSAFREAVLKSENPLALAHRWDKGGRRDFARKILEAAASADWTAQDTVPFTPRQAGLLASAAVLQLAALDEEEYRFERAAALLRDQIDWIERDRQFAGDRALQDAADRLRRKEVLLLGRLASEAQVRGGGDPAEIFREIAGRTEKISGWERDPELAALYDKAELALSGPREEGLTPAQARDEPEQAADFAARLERLKAYVQASVQRGNGVSELWDHPEVVLFQDTVRQFALPEEAERLTAELDGFLHGLLHRTFRQRIESLAAEMESRLDEFALPQNLFEVPDVAALETDLRRHAAEHPQYRFLYDAFERQFTDFAYRIWMKMHQSALHYLKTNRNILSDFMADISKEIQDAKTDFEFRNYDLAYRAYEAIEKKLIEASESEMPAFVRYSTLSRVIVAKSRALRYDKSLRSERFGKALEIMDAALEHIDPWSPFLLVEKGWIYLTWAKHLPREREKAQEYLKNAEAVADSLSSLRFSDGSAADLKQAVADVGKELGQRRSELRPDSFESGTREQSGTGRSELRADSFESGTREQSGTGRSELRADSFESGTREQSGTGRSELRAFENPENHFWRRQEALRPHEAVTPGKIRRAREILNHYWNGIGELNPDVASGREFRIPLIHDPSLDLLMEKITGIRNRYYLYYLPELPEGSFKPYLAADLLDAYYEDPSLLLRLETVIAESTGNQGRAVASLVRNLKKHPHYAPFAQHLQAVIFVPKDANPEKIREMEALGAVVVKNAFSEETLRAYVAATPQERKRIISQSAAPSFEEYKEASRYVEDFAARNPLTAHYIRHGSSMGIAAYGVIMLEALDQWYRRFAGIDKAFVPSADFDRFTRLLATDGAFDRVRFWVPGGSAGLGSGISQVKLWNPRVQVYLTQVPGVDHLFMSLRQGSLIPKDLAFFDPEALRYVDGIAATAEDITFDIIRQMADGVMRVPYQDNNRMARLVQSLDLHYKSLLKGFGIFESELASYLPLTNAAYARRFATLDPRLLEEGKHIIIPVTGKVMAANLEEEIAALAKHEALEALERHSRSELRPDSFESGTREQSGTGRSELRPFSFESGTREQSGTGRSELRAVDKEIKKILEAISQHIDEGALDAAGQMLENFYQEHDLEEGDVRRNFLWLEARLAYETTDFSRARDLLESIRREAPEFINVVGNLPLKSYEAKIDLFEKYVRKMQEKGYRFVRKLGSGAFGDAYLFEKEEDPADKTVLKMIGGANLDMMDAKDRKSARTSLGLDFYRGEQFYRAVGNDESKAYLPRNREGFDRRDLNKGYSFEAITMEFVEGSFYPQAVAALEGKQALAVKRRFTEKFIAFIRTLKEADFFLWDFRPDNFLVTVQGDDIDFKMVDRALLIPYEENPRPSFAAQGAIFGYETITGEELSKRHARQIREIFGLPPEERKPARSELRSASLFLGTDGADLMGYLEQNRASIVAVAESLTSRIFAVFYAPLLLKELFGDAEAYGAEKSAAFSEGEANRLATEAAYLLKLGGHAVLPAGAFLALSEPARSLFVEVMLEGAASAGLSGRPRIYFAGEGAAELKKSFYTMDIFRRNPAAGALFAISMQEEWVMGARLHREAVSISFEHYHESSPLNPAIPAFFIRTQEVDQLPDETDKARYLVRLTQLQLLAASHLKDQLGEDAGKKMAEFLAQTGVAYGKGPMGFLEPSAQSLLSEALGQFLASYTATARSA